MHLSSKIKMERFAQMCKNIYSGETRKISLLDVGGVRVSYSDIFKNYL